MKSIVQATIYKNVNRIQGAISIPASISTIRENPCDPVRQGKPDRSYGMKGFHRGNYSFTTVVDWAVSSGN